MKIYSFYKLTNLINGQQYIGYTGKSVLERWTEHLRAVSENKKNYHLYNSIRKHGSDNWSVEEIDQKYCSQKEALEREKQLIDQNGTFKYGLNMTAGGIGGNLISKYSQLQLFEINEKKKSTRIKNFGSMKWTANSWKHYNSLTAEQKVEINKKRSATLLKQKVEHGLKIKNAHASRSADDKNKTAELISKKIKAAYDHRRLDNDVWNEYRLCLVKRTGRQISTPLGIFDSIKHASKITNIPSSTLLRKLKDTNNAEYKYCD